MSNLFVANSWTCQIFYAKILNWEQVVEIKTEQNLSKLQVEEKIMKASEVAKLLNAEVIAGADKLDIDLKSACGSDMMSDVLAYVKDQGMLLTGLVNSQVIRTAEMMDMHCVVFVRGKMPDSAMIALAENKGIILMTSKMRMYLACGVLYSAGLGAGEPV